MNTVKAITHEIIDFPKKKMIDSRIRKLEELEREARQIKKEIDSIKDEIKKAMSGAEELETATYIIKNTVFTRTTVNSDKVKEVFPVAEYPELYKEAQTTRFTYKKA